MSGKKFGKVVKALKKIDQYGQIAAIRHFKKSCIGGSITVFVLGCTLTYGLYNLISEL